MRIVALVPARGGSERIEKKNLERIAGHPLVGIAVREALKSEVFERVICSTDDEEIARVAKEYGAEVVMRPAEYATSVSPDVEWVRHVMHSFQSEPGFEDWPDAFSILRPTSPFRTAETIKRAFEQFTQLKNVNSMRAVQPVSERPEKMWRLGTGYSMEPAFFKAFSFGEGKRRLYEQQSASFSLLYIQNACLEMAWTKVLPYSVAGDVVAPFFTQGYEGIDINEPDDLEYARWLVESGKVTLWK